MLYDITRLRDCSRFIKDFNPTTSWDHQRQLSNNSRGQQSHVCIHSGCYQQLRYYRIYVHPRQRTMRSKRAAGSQLELLYGYKQLNVPSYFTFSMKRFRAQFLASDSNSNKYLYEYRLPRGRRGELSASGMEQ